MEKVKKIKSSWKTTLLGALAGVPLLVQGIISNNPVTIAEGVCLIVGGVIAKDYDK